MVLGLLPTTELQVLCFVLVGFCKADGLLKTATSGGEIKKTDWVLADLFAKKNLTYPV